MAVHEENDGYSVVFASLTEAEKLLSSETLKVLLLFLHYDDCNSRNSSVI